MLHLFWMYVLQLFTIQLLYLENNEIYLINSFKIKTYIHILDLWKLYFSILSLVNAIYCNSSIFIFFYFMHDNFILLLNKSTRKRQWYIEISRWGFWYASWYLLIPYHSILSLYKKTAFSIFHLQTGPTH